MSNPMPQKANSPVQPWRKYYKGGSNNRFNPLISTIKQSAGRQIVLFVHTGKCAGESILKGMVKLFGSDVLIFEYHVFDGNERLLDALDYFHENTSELASVVIATRDPLRRWVSSYNWDLHNLFLSKNYQPPEGFSKYPDVNKLAIGIKERERLALKFGKFGHMGMGISWYLPIDKHLLLDRENTYILRTEELDSDFHAFVNHYYNSRNLQAGDVRVNSQVLSHSKHNFQSSYPKDTFRDLDYSNTELVEAMREYLKEDIEAHYNLVNTFFANKDA
jgi:hypothetical protein